MPVKKDEIWVQKNKNEAGANEIIWNPLKEKAVKCYNNIKWSCYQYNKSELDVSERKWNKGQYKNNETGANK